VTVAFGDFHPGGAHFINSSIGLFLHVLVPSKSTGVNRIGVGNPSRSLTCLICSNLLGLARWTQFPSTLAMAPQNPYAA
jgi:hypothetical protein